MIASRNSYDCCFNIVVYGVETNNLDVVKHVFGRLGGETTTYGLMSFLVIIQVIVVYAGELKLLS